MGDKILLVGFACVDIILVCDSYPKIEDACTRINDLVKRRGGNCSNSATVLSELGVPCHLFTSFGTDEAAEWSIKDLTDRGVVLTHCPRNQIKTPTTYTVLSEETGSRTFFVWKNNFHGPKYEDFLKLDLTEFIWVHFEGRNINEILKMIGHVRDWNKSRDKSKQLKISVEIERENISIADLIPLGDVVIISEGFARFVGANSMEKTIEKYKSVIKPDAFLVVPWGELGASAYSPDGSIFVQPAFPPPKVIDTIAAGDTFIASLISRLAKKKSMQEAVTFACRIAGAKVGIMGFDGLGRVAS